MIVIENDFLIDVLHHKLIRNFSRSSSIEIGMNIEILGSHCFSSCDSLSSITFESNSCLTRIESSAFSFSSLESILIPNNVEILGSKCFSYCQLLSSITFESNSHLARIESEAFYGSSLESILIPQNVEILGSKCFSYCRSFSSITFESDSHLARIESEAFSFSSLQSIAIPRNVQFIDGSAFVGVTLSSIIIESGNEMFVIGDGLLIDVLHHRLIRNFSTSSSIEIGMNIEILGSHCFSWCQSLSSITVESNPRLMRNVRLTVIAEEAFSHSGLRAIVIPVTVRIIEKRAFYDCFCLTELQWAEGSEVEVLEEEAFERTNLSAFEIRGSLQYIGARICPGATRLLLPKESTKRMFGEWMALFVHNRDVVMGTRPGCELADGTDREHGDKEKDGQEDESKSSKCCTLL
jgi:hypothetical protein